VKVLTDAPRPPKLVEQCHVTVGGFRYALWPSDAVPNAAFVSMNGRVTPECCEQIADTFNNLARVLRGQPQE
jgi:hypothetical protein